MAGTTTKSPGLGQDTHAKADRRFIDAVYYFSEIANAREANNGWGGQPIPNRTDPFKGIIGTLIKWWLSQNPKSGGSKIAD